MAKVRTVIAQWRHTPPICYPEAFHQIHFRVPERYQKDVSGGYHDDILDEKDANSRFRALAAPPSFDRQIYNPMKP
jgi:hypothetical protein